MQAILEKLVELEIQLMPLPQVERHWVFERGGFIALVERTCENGFGNIGSAGLLTEVGMAVLVERGGRHVFLAKGFEQHASSEQVALVRRFADDLKAALSA